MKIYKKEIQLNNGVEFILNRLSINAVKYDADITIKITIAIMKKITMIFIIHKNSSTTHFTDEAENAHFSTTNNLQ